MESRRLFVAEAVVGASHRLAPDLADFLRDSEPGDYFFSTRMLQHDAVVMVRSNQLGHLYRRVE